MALRSFGEELPDGQLDQQSGGAPRVMRATIETARPADEPAVFTLLAGAREPKLLQRPAADYSRSIGQGLFCVVRSAGEIVAVAGAFPLADSCAEASPVFVEMGSCYVAAPLRGFGLQKLLVRARIAAAIALVDPQARILTAVTPENLGSRTSILKAGFEPLDEHARHLLELCAYCVAPPSAASGRLCCCDFFHIPPERQRSEIAALLRPGSVAVARANGERLSVAMEIDALRAPHRAALEIFARSDANA